MDTDDDDDDTCDVVVPRNVAHNVTHSTTHNNNDDDDDFEYQNGNGDAGNAETAREETRFYFPVSLLHFDSLSFGLRITVLRN